MKSIEKVKLLFEYLAELSTIKSRVVTDINNQEWNLFLDDIPKDDTYVKLFTRDGSDLENKSVEKLLSVSKPDFKKCPVPPESIEDWLEEDWEDFFKNDVIKERKLKQSFEIESVDDPKLIYDFFNKSQRRVKDASIWLTKRQEWVDSQKITKATRDFFTDLYISYTLLERESEKFELLVGNGVIKYLDDDKINHPILLKRVSFDFDSLNNTLSIIDTDSESTIYSSLLKDIEDINHGSLQSVQETLENNNIHPLDNQEAKDFLKELTNKLSSRSRFLASDLEKMGYGDNISVSFKPVFLIRKRIDGTPEMIANIRKDLDSRGTVEGYFSDLVGEKRKVKNHNNEYRELTIDQRLAATSGEDIDILLSKEANREQLEIAQRIEENNAVVVQGPPGTGKTHTIANLLGHFLAQGKTVLVTSHTKKALSVLKSHVPKDIQNLCVSILDDSNQDMVSSVDGITSRLSKETSAGLKNTIETKKQEREEIIKELSETRRNIFAIKNREFKSIVYKGVGYTPIKAAQFVAENKDKLSYIPGNVEVDATLPASIKELNLLYQSNENLSKNDEQELSLSIPNPKELISVKDFENYVKFENQATIDIKSIEKSLNLKIKFDFIKDQVINEKNFNSVLVSKLPTDEQLIKFDDFIENFNQIEDWMIQVAVDGKKSGNFKQSWHDLIDSIDILSSYSEKIYTEMLGHKISFNDFNILAKFKDDFYKLSDTYKRKGKIGRFYFTFDREFEDVYSQVTVDGSPIKSHKDCELILIKIEQHEKYLHAENLWDTLMGTKGSPLFSELGDRPWELAQKRIPKILKYLDWYKIEYPNLQLVLQNVGIVEKEIFEFEEFDTDFTRISKVFMMVANKLPHFSRLIKIFKTLKSNKKIEMETINLLSIDSRKESQICNEMINSINKRDKDAYGDNYFDVSKLHKKYELQRNREQVLGRIFNVAPEWSVAIRNRIGIHGEKHCPDNIEDAWKWKQFKAIIDELTKEPLEHLQYKSLELSKLLRIKTGELASDKAWYHLLLRTEEDVSLRQSLNGWKITTQKIGKGYGKRVAKLKNEARNKMEKSQKAVPAWIMPLSRVFESFKVPDNLFDVLIIDEASQSDVTALAALYLAKKIIIVGDDKQVSPLAVGANISKIDNLRDGFIKEKIPNWILYDATTSLYDIASTTFEPIMLKEHFRCVPEIIGYSNKLSYDGEILPLRDAKSSSLTPAVVSYRVKDGKRHSRQRINVKEADEIVALIEACIEEPEYEGQTFGVISLLGSEQAQLIERKILEKIPLSEINSREILCGDASNFQGDERDVVFISLVDSNEEEGPMRLRGVGAADSTKQRYNVATSRARNQLWVIHSLDYTRDLKTGDMRKDLIEYAENPKEFAKIIEDIEKKADSPFEIEVAKRLINAGYNIQQQWPVGSYRIDMVAQYEGNKIAIECDGEQYHSGEEQVRKDMERQTQLERTGWNFVRLRGSEYYSDKNAAIDRVKKDLNKLGIKPETMITNEKEKESELISNIKNRANQILNNGFNKNSYKLKDYNDDLHSYTTKKPGNIEEY